MTIQKRTSVKILERMSQIVDRYKLDELSFNGITVKKSRHVFDAPTQAKPNINNPYFDPTTMEELDAVIAKELGISK